MPNRQLPWARGRRVIGARLVIEPAVAEAMRRAAGVIAGSRASGRIRLAAFRALHFERASAHPAPDGSLPIRLVVEAASPTPAAAPGVAAAGAPEPVNTTAEASRSLPIRSVAEPVVPAPAAAPAPQVTAPPIQDLAAEFAGIASDPQALENYRSSTYDGPVYASDIYTKEVWVVSQDSLAVRTLRDATGDIVQHWWYGYRWIRDDGRNNLRKELRMVEEQMRRWAWAKNVKAEGLSEEKAKKREWVLRLAEMRKERGFGLPTTKKHLERLIKMPMGPLVSSMTALEDWRVCQLEMRGFETGWRVRGGRMTMKKSEWDMREEEIRAKWRTERKEKKMMKEEERAKKRSMDEEGRDGVTKKAKVEDAKAEAANALRKGTTSENKSEEMMDSEKTLG